MQEYSERELLILSNYVYFSCSSWDGSIGENIDRLKDDKGKFDLKKINSQGAVSCNISEDEAVKLLSDIDADERLRSLTLSRKLNEKDIRAICYTDSNNESCVIFRGTGGTYNAWKDNVTGEYLKDTKLQKLAKDFIIDECSQYKSLVVAGHSKGGNLAQYVTVTCENQVERCLSFDGQGFGQTFLNEYKDEIARNKNKITSVSAYNDYVNILLYSIAGSTLYVKNKGANIDGHSSYTLYDSITFNEKGDIDRLSSSMFQGPVSRKMNEVLDTAVSLIDLLPGEGRQKATNILAAAVAGCMSYDKSDYYVDNEIKSAVTDFKNYAKSLIGLCDDCGLVINIVNERNEYSGNSMINAAKIFMDSSKSLLSLVERVEEVKNTENINLSARGFIDKSLEKIEDKLIRSSDMLIKHSNFLVKTNRIFERNEMDISEAMTEVF